MNFAVLVSWLHASNYNNYKNSGSQNTGSSIDASCVNGVYTYLVQKKSMEF